MNTIESIYAIVKDWWEASKVATGSYTPSVDELSGLVVKIAKQWNIVQNFNDKLPELDGERMPYGGVLEEWQSGLANVEDYDINGANALAPRYLKHLPPAYSYLQDKKKIVITKPYDVVQKAMINEEAYAAFITDITKRLVDTYNAFKYRSKRELIGTAINACDAAMDTATTYSATTAYNAGQYVKSGSDVYVIVEKKNTTNITIADMVKQGKAVKLDLRSTLALPTDEATGEAFIKEIKKWAEIAEDINEGHSLNGGALGAQEGLVLYVKFGVMPSLDVDTLAGAFHLDKLALPVTVKRLPDFGNGNEKAFAFLVDQRGLRRFPHYDRVDSQENGDGDFINYFHHFQDLYAYSKNVFMRVFETE